MAGSMPALAASPIIRKGPTLIIPVPAPRQAAILPPLCVKCGAPADGKPVEKTFYWHHPALFLLILAGLLIYAIVALVVRKSIRVRVPLCALHAQRRSTAITLAWVLPVIGVADAFILPGFGVDGGWVGMTTLLLLLAGLIIWAVISNPIRVKSIDQYCGVFSGFCETFLQQFPEAVPQMPAAAAPLQATPPPPPI